MRNKSSDRYNEWRNSGSALSAYAGLQPRKRRLSPPKLTEIRRRALDFINAYESQSGFAPTFREIGAAVDRYSSSTVHELVKSLEQLGLVARDPKSPRALRLTPRGLLVVASGGDALAPGRYPAARYVVSGQAAA